jgi:hypothetical protein
LLRVVGRGDEAEVIAITGAALGECAVVSVVALGIEHAAGRAVLGDAIAPQVFKMRGERRALDPVPDDPRFHYRAARPLSQPPGGRKACRPATTEGAAPRAVA